MIYRGNNKFGFSLTELLIVLVVVAVMFAAMAPIMTKRRVSTKNWRSESVWHYSPGDSQLSAYYDVNAIDYSPVDSTLLENGMSGELYQQASQYLKNVKQRAESGDAPAIAFMAHGLMNSPLSTTNGTSTTYHTPEGFSDVYNKYVSMKSYNSYQSNNVRHMRSLPVRGAKIIELVQPAKNTDGVEIWKKEAQHAIQFRYGNGDGLNAGTFYVDNRGVFALGSGYTLTNRDASKKNYLGSSEVSKPAVTVVGRDALRNVNIIENATVVGDNAVSVSDYECNVIGHNCNSRGINFLPDDESLNSKNNYRSHSTKITSIGYNSGKISTSGKLSTFYDVNALFLGSNTGVINEPSDRKNYNNLAVGYNSLNHPMFTGTNNVVLGENVATSLGYANNNVLVNTNFAKTAPNYRTPFKGDNNTIIGVQFVNPNVSEISNFTAIGYNACKNFKGYGNNNPPVTCIGADTVAPTINNVTVDDSYVFLGGESPISGHSVLEVYDVAGVYQPADGAKKITNSSVVLNSNLILRGDLYVGARDSSSNDDSVIHYMRPVAINSGLSPEKKYYSHNYLNYVRLHDNFYHTLGGIDLGQKRGAYLLSSGAPYKPNPQAGSAWFKRANGANDSDNNNTFNCPSCEHGSNTPDTYFMLRGALFPALDYSDIRLKENLTLNNSGLAEILKLQPYTYTFIYDKKQIPQVGVIAQDLQRVFPNSVKKGEDGFLRIRWNEMFFAMINAIKELGAKVEKLATEIFRMENDVNDIDKNNKSIKKRVAELNARAAKLERK